MPDRFYTHQHAQSGQKADPGGDNIRPVSSMYTRLDGSMGLAHTSAEEGTIAVAPHTMMRSYEKPKRRARDTGKTLCAGLDDKECRAYPMKDSEYCIAHARTLGLAPKWKKDSDGDIDDAG